MKSILGMAGVAVSLLVVGQVAMGQVIHASVRVASPVPADAPWAMAGLVGLITVVVFRFLKQGKK